MDSCQTNHFTFDAINLSQRSLFRVIGLYEVLRAVHMPMAPTRYIYSVERIPHGCAEREMIMNL